MIDCEGCGAKNHPNAKFCYSCGKPIVRLSVDEHEMICSACGAKNHTKAKYCYSCGRLLQNVLEENPHNDLQAETFVLSQQSNNPIISNVDENKGFLVVCPNCAVQNRLRPEQNLSAATCGVCHQPLDSQNTKATQRIDETNMQQKDASSRKIGRALLIVLLIVSICYGAVSFFGDNGSKSGRGTLKLPDGSTYTGEIRNRMPNGNGTLTKNNTKYVGGFRQGKYDGEGTMTGPLGTFQGFFKNGRADGPGTKTWPDGRSMKCNYTNGLAEGIAFIVEPNEDYIYEQTYSAGNPVGTRSKKAPFRINDINVYNASKNGTILSRSMPFPHDSVRFVSYNMQLVSCFPRSINGELKIVYRMSDGEVKRNPAISPEGASTMAKIFLPAEVNSYNTQQIQGGWGNENVGIYKKGRHKIEFWWQDVKVGEKEFDVS